MTKTMREGRKEFEKMMNDLALKVVDKKTASEALWVIWNWHISELQKEREKVLKEVIKQIKSLQEEPTRQGIIDIINRLKEK